MTKNKRDEFVVFDVGDTIRMPAYPTSGGYRVWHVVAVHLGATYQEGTYGLATVDLEENEVIQVPCIILESHPLIHKV